jgi:hypothetical protein
MLRHTMCFVTFSRYLSVAPRFARHFVQNGTNRRHLFKVFGIRFDILVDGKVSVLCEGMAAKAPSCFGCLLLWMI